MSKYVITGVDFARDAKVEAKRKKKRTKRAVNVILGLCGLTSTFLLLWGWIWLTNYTWTQIHPSLGLAVCFFPVLVAVEGVGVWFHNAD